MIRARRDPHEVLAKLGTVLGSKLETSVMVGSLLVPANALFPILAKRCVGLSLYTGVPDFAVSLRGSGTPIILNGSLLVVCTRHQVYADTGVSDEYRRIGLMDPESGNLLTSQAFAGDHSHPFNSPTDAFQLCAFDFTDPLIARSPALRQHFFDLSQTPIWDGEEEPLLILSYGLPFADQGFDIYEKRAIHQVIREVTLRNLSQTSDPHLLRAEPYFNLPLDPNGMSGGPVFVVCESSGQLRLYIVGIICRGGARCLHFIGPDALRLFLGWWSRTPISASESEPIG